MAHLFYLDTSIWRDYFEDRKNHIKPLGELAFQFLKECKKRRFKLVYSDLVVFELKKSYSDEKIKQLFSPFADNLVLAEISEKQRLEAVKLESIKDAHKADILHAIIARDEKAVLVSRDKHFDCLTDIVEVLKPEEVRFD
ncbi:MAG: PIN domain-containing protein [archaeon]